MNDNSAAAYDVAYKAQCHLASLPPHLQGRYSATLIKEMAEEIERLRSDAGRLNREVSILVRECQTQKDLLVNGATLTDAERDAVKTAIGAIDWQQAYFSHLRHGEPLPSAALRGLLERMGGGR